MRVLSSELKESVCTPEIVCVCVCFEIIGRNVCIRLRRLERICVCIHLFECVHACVCVKEREQSNSFDLG